MKAPMRALLRQNHSKLPNPTGVVNYKYEKRNPVSDQALADHGGDGHRGNHGPARGDRLNFTVLGARVNLAARLCDVASAMTAVIDLNTLEALGNNTSAEALPDLELKGFSQTWTAFHLKDPAPDPDSPGIKAVVAD